MDLNSQEYIDWAHEVLKKATINQASKIMDLRADGWILRDELPYGYEDELEEEMPERSMYVLEREQVVILVNQAGGILMRQN